jgi:hypothetical protein
MTSNNLPNFTSLSIKDLAKVYGQVITELKRRGAIRSKNVIGDLGESLAIEFYNTTPNLPKLQAAPTGTQNVDALSRNGERYSIKSTTSNITGVFYGLPPKGSEELPLQKFEYVIIVRFGQDYQPAGIYELTWEQFLEYKHWHSRMNAWNLSLNRKVIAASKMIFEINTKPNE